MKITYLLNSQHIDEYQPAELISLIDCVAE
jgi:hypothetical protein